MTKTAKMGFNETQMEFNYWKGILDDLFAGATLRKEIVADLIAGTIFVNVLHPTDVGQLGKHPELAAKINLNRKERSEATIVAEIKKAIKAKTDLG